MEIHQENRFLGVINGLMFHQVRVGHEEISLPAGNESQPADTFSISANTGIREIFIDMRAVNYQPITSTIPNWLPDWFQFCEWARDWKRNRRHSSRADQLAMHPSYQRIIGMGPSKAVRCILMQLRYELATGEPDHWFWALWALTGENPVPEQDRGNIFKMAKAWIAWEQRAGNVYGEGMGGAVSQP